MYRFTYDGDEVTLALDGGGAKQPKSNPAKRMVSGCGAPAAQASESCRGEGGTSFRGSRRICGQVRQGARLPQVGSVSDMEFKVTRLMRMLVSLCQTLEKVPDEVSEGQWGLPSQNSVCCGEVASLPLALDARIVLSNSPRI